MSGPVHIGSKSSSGPYAPGLYDFLDDKIAVDADGKEEPWKPNRRKVADVIEALAAVVHLDDRVSYPCWLDGRPERPIVACANGLLDVLSGELLTHTPIYFNLAAVPFDYDPDADDPERGEQFLDDLWGDDREQIAALQEWCGYVISGRLDLHKILLLTGPTRGGKGVIARISARSSGPCSVAGPTLTSLQDDFGLAPLLGKTLAVVSDARLNGGRDGSKVVERLLSISGEDMISVNRKYREQVTTKIAARFMLCSNELPEFGDASGAIAGRMVPLMLTRSFLGVENLDLELGLLDELPGILNWALAGLRQA